MTSYKSYAMDSFQNCSSNDTVRSNGLTKKIPPGKSCQAVFSHDSLNEIKMTKLATQIEHFNNHSLVTNKEIKFNFFV